MRDFHRVHSVYYKALLGFEPRISCLLDRRFNQLSHSATAMILRMSEERAKQTDIKNLGRCRKVQNSFEVNIFHVSYSHLFPCGREQ